MAESASASLKIFGPPPGSPDAPTRSERMRARLERYFEISVFLLLTSGFVAVATTGALDFYSVAFVAFALLVRGWLLLKDSKLSMPLAWDPYFTFGYVAFYAADYFLFSRAFVDATIHLVLFSMVVKIFSVRRDRDYVYLAVLAFMEVLAASVLTVDTVFLASFVVFALLAVNTFIAFEIRRSWKAPSGDADGNASATTYSYAPRMFSRSLSAVALALLFGIVIVASAIFFVLPRITAGYLSRFAPKNRIETGFTDDVQLGQIGEIQQSSAVTMHIEVAGDTSGSNDLKWRGVALANFDGHRWTNPLPRSEAVPWAGECFIVTQDEERQATNACFSSLDEQEHVIRYRVLMEPIGTNVFFLAPKPYAVRGKYRSVMIDGAGSVFNADLNRSVDIYEGMSDVSSPTPDRLRASADFYPAGILRIYLQSPNLDPRIEQLAKKVTASAPTAYDKAATIEHYLQTNYAYTLQLPQVQPRDPVADFLFQRKAGHCEYFASAMAIMLRTIGIPSRIVNGFRGGEFNYVSGKYIVRARDAHSWVEVYFPGSGWVSFDPTPAGGDSANMAHSRLVLYVDAMRDFWREWIVNYDYGHQRALGNLGVTSAIKSFQDARHWFRNRYVALLLKSFDLRNRAARHPAKWLYGVAAAAAMLALLLNLRRIKWAVRARRFVRNPGSAPEGAASFWYRRMLGTLRKRGLQKVPSHTAGEFAASISDPALRSSVALFISHYERARFADSAPDAERLPSLFEAVRMVARQR